MPRTIPPPNKTKSISNNKKVHEKNIMSKLWIKIKNKRPPKTRIYNILGWNYKIKRAIITSGELLNLQHDQIQSKKIVLNMDNEKPYHFSGYYVDRWMFLYPPEGEEYNDDNT
jgi:hypothetical protein